MKRIKKIIISMMCAAVICSMMTACSTEPIPEEGVIEEDLNDMTDDIEEGVEDGIEDLDPNVEKSYE